MCATEYNQSQQVRSESARKVAANIPVTVKDCHTLQRASFRPEYNRVRVDGEKSDLFICQVPAPMSATRRTCEVNELLPKVRFHPISQPDMGISIPTRSSTGSGARR